MNEELLPKHFDFKEAEGRIYQRWLDKGYFKANPNPDKPPFCVVIPPPNVTGILHMGHILDETPQDVITRWHRMRGYEALWIPGTDHAGIATQHVVIKQLAQQGIDYHDLSREEFINKVWEWKKEKGGIIINQLKRLGCSCDWDRERFTMDEGFIRAVLTAFKQLYDKGLVYRGKRMINWCTHDLTALATDEVEHKAKKSNLWHLRYPVVGTEEHLVVATTRPETMLGDTAVAVNPKDERYTYLHGKRVKLPLTDREIPIILDEYVDMEFGTGLVKVTPAHDPNDYEMGLTHDLPQIQVIGEDGTMTEAAGPEYAGLERFACRKKVVADLEEQGYLEKIEPYKHSVGCCYRCGNVVEPMISDQWFVKMKPLIEPALEAVRENRIRVEPESERNDFFTWAEDIRDWCISRQLWWGHRIPVFTCKDCGKEWVSVEGADTCPDCQSKQIEQDPDVLDTWFSSWLWPFGTLGWPEKTPELDYFYPTTWLLSGRDILFFWDMRMIMAGLEFMGDIPFHTLFLHGIARDAKGIKLSKSLGNSPDPLLLLDEYGADAIRFGMNSRYPMGRQDIRLSKELYLSGRSLVTKLWNASRLLLMNLPEGGIRFDSSSMEPQRVEDQWILHELNETIQKVDRAFENSDFEQAAEITRHFFWDSFCDWYLELIKPRLAKEETRPEALSWALYTLRRIVQLFHPIVPFVTEELWQKMNELGVADEAERDEDRESITISRWPVVRESFTNEKSRQTIDALITLVTSVRELRSFLQISPKLPLELALHFANDEAHTAFDAYRDRLADIGFVEGLTVQQDAAIPAGFVPVVFSQGTGFVRIPADVDLGEILGRTENKLAKTEKEVISLTKRLENPNFVQKADPDTVAQTRDFLEKATRAVKTLSDMAALIREVKG